MGAGAVLRPGETCWRVERAHRTAFLIDGERFFAAVDDALARARRSVLILGWDFDPRITLRPGADRTLGGRLHDLVTARPELTVRVLRWDTPVPITLEHPQAPMGRLHRNSGRRLQARPDGALPTGAAQHQKIVVIDGALAFCGGIDLAGDRWDTPAHLDSDPRRRWPTGMPCPPRHDLMMAVDGPAAAALERLVRQRWEEATGERLDPPATAASDPWPPALVPDLRDVDVAIARTRPEREGAPAVRESEAMLLAALRAARRSVYIENQYVTDTRVAALLAGRLAEPDGPEVVIVSSKASPSWFDRISMDRARSVILHRLRRADRFGRLRAVMPLTEGGTGIIVHSKLLVVDDGFVRLGSSNLNHRSTGYDTECDLAIEAPADGPAAASVRAAIRGLRDRLLAEHLGMPVLRFRTALERAGCLTGAIDQLARPRGKRLAPLSGRSPGPLDEAVALIRFADPGATAEAWAPWRRLDARIGGVIARTASIGGAFALGFALHAALRLRVGAPR